MESGRVATNQVHMSGLVSCGKCARYIRVAESACPFCRARQGSGLAPRLGFAFALAFVTVTTIACQDDEEGDSVSDTANTSKGSVGNDTITDGGDWGEGSTYAGPDEFDTTGPSDPSPSPDGTTTGSGSSTTMDQTDWGEGSTYAGPDEFDTTGPTGSSSGDGDAAESGSTAG